MSIDNSRTFTDKYGDTLEVGDDGSEDRIYFEFRIKDGSNQLAFSREQSVEIAEKLLTGGRTPVTIFHEDGDERTSWNHTALESALAHGRVASFSYTKEREVQRVHLNIDPVTADKLYDLLGREPAYDWSASLFNALTDARQAAKRTHDDQVVVAR